MLGFDSLWISFSLCFSVILLAVNLVISINTYIWANATQQQCAEMSVSVQPCISPFMLSPKILPSDCVPIVKLYNYFL
jgi:hypothetical protein